MISSQILTNAIGSWKRLGWLRLIALVAAQLPAPHQALAAPNPVKAITQYTQDVWGTEAGLPHNSVTSIAQTPEGYLWLGTEEGLARFDGARFSVFDKENTPGLGSNRISALLVDSRKNLWIGTEGGGLTQYTGSKFISYTTRNGLSNDAILCLYEDRKGALWVGTDGGGLNLLHNGHFQKYSSENGLPNDAVFSISGSQDGTIWVGTHAGVARLKNEKITVFTTRDGLGDDYAKSVRVGRSGDLWIGTNGGGLSRFVNGRFTTYTTRDGLSSNSIWSTYEDTQGTIWVGTTDAGLSRFHDGKFSTYTTKEGAPFSRVFAFAEDKEGDLWIGTGGTGLVRLKDGSFTTISSREGLSSNVVLPVYEDREGAVWLGTNGGGLNRIKDGTVTTYTTRDGLCDDVVFSIAEDREGSLWVGTSRGLNRLQHGRLSAFTTRDGLPTNIILSLYRDREGTLWAGSRGGLSRFDGVRFKTYTVTDGLSDNHVSAIYADRENTLWIGTGGGGLNRFRNERFSLYTTKDGLSNNAIRSLTGDTDETLWIGTSGGGLNRFKDGRFTVYTTRQGLYDDDLFQILPDRYGYLWMSSNKGVFRVPKDQLKAFAAGRLASITSTSYGVSDGLKNKECNGGFQPAGWETKDGRLLFPTMNGLATVDPGKLSHNRVPPPVVIEQVGIDGTNFEPANRIQARPGKGQFEFSFTALSLVSSDKIRFKYKLEEFDKDWVEAGRRRVAYYTNIPPGEYRFRVVATNNDGVWNTEGASVPVTLLPHFYQTSLFRALCTIFVVGICFTAYRLRINHLRANEKKLVLLIDERTQALQEQVHAKERARAELAEAQQSLIELSRQSGMAEVATGVLHNVGNVLNSVNVGAVYVATKIRELRLDHLSSAVGMLQEHAHDLSSFVATDPKGQRVVPYLAKLSGHFQSERQHLLTELETLTNHIDHIKHIVSAQQDYAKVSTLIEPVSISSIVESALTMVQSSFTRHQIEVLRHFEDVPTVSTAKHKVLEILVNLLRNAKQAVVDYNGPLRQVRVSIRCHADHWVRVEVQDTGVGVAPENLIRLFAHGFTTKPKGHGFGLHSGALAARQMHGSLWAESEGPGCGATFILELPLDVAAVVPEQSAA